MNYKNVKSIDSLIKKAEVDETLPVELSLDKTLPGQSKAVLGLGEYLIRLSETAKAMVFERDQTAREDLYKDMEKYINLIDEQVDIIRSTEPFGEIEKESNIKIAIGPIAVLAWLPVAVAVLKELPGMVQSIKELISVLRNKGEDDKADAIYEATRKTGLDFGEPPEKLREELKKLEA